MSTARVQISPSAPSVAADCVCSRRRFLAVKTTYGEIPKWFKGPVLKTGRWVTPTQGFESLSLRHVRAHCAPAVKTSLWTGFYFVRSMALPFSRRTRSAGLRRERRLINYLYSPVIGFEKAAAIHPYFFPVIICCRISRKTAA